MKRAEFSKESYKLFEYVLKQLTKTNSAISELDKHIKMFYENDLQSPKDSEYMLKCYEDGLPVIDDIITALRNIGNKETLRKFLESKGDEESLR